MTPAHVIAAARLADDLRAIQTMTPTLNALERAPSYLDTPDESEARMSMDLAFFIDRHGLEAFERVCAYALRSACDTALARAGMLTPTREEIERVRARVFGEIALEVTP